MKQQPKIIVSVTESNQPSENALKQFNQSFMDFMKKIEDGKSDLKEAKQ